MVRFHVSQLVVLAVVATAVSVQIVLLASTFCIV